MLGALLVTASLSGSWWLGQRDEGPPPGSWLVAATDLAPGQVLGRDDVEVRSLHLPAELAGRAVPASRRSELDGRVVLGPVAQGELVQAGAVGAPAPDDRARELSLRVEADWALAGTLAAGDRVDLLVTYGEGSGSSTTRVLAGSVLRSVRSVEGDRMLGAATAVLTVAIDDPDRVLAVTNAARAGAITVVRATAADPVGHDRSFRPDEGEGP